MTDTHAVCVRSVRYAEADGTEVVYHDAVPDPLGKVRRLAGLCEIRHIADKGGVLEEPLLALRSGRRERRHAFLSTLEGLGRDNLDAVLVLVPEANDAGARGAKGSQAQAILLKSMRLEDLEPRKGIDAARAAKIKDSVSQG